MKTAHFLSVSSLAILVGLGLSSPLMAQTITSQTAPIDTPTTSVTKDQSFYRTSDQDHSGEADDKDNKNVSDGIDRDHADINRHNQSNMDGKGDDNYLDKSKDRHTSQDRDRDHFAFNRSGKSDVNRDHDDQFNAQQKNGDEHDRASTAGNRVDGSEKDHDEHKVSSSDQHVNQGRDRDHFAINRSESSSRVDREYDEHDDQFKSRQANDHDRDNLAKNRSNGSENVRDEHHDSFDQDGNLQDQHDGQKDNVADRGNSEHSQSTTNNLGNQPEVNGNDGEHHSFEQVDLKDGEESSPHAQQGITNMGDKMDRANTVSAAPQAPHAMRHTSPVVPPHITAAHTK